MRCKAAWWYSAALAAAGSLHLILYVRYVHTRIVRGVRRKLFVMYTNTAAQSVTTLMTLDEANSLVEGHGGRVDLIQHPYEGLVMPKYYEIGEARQRLPLAVLGTATLADGGELLIAHPLDHHCCTREEVQNWRSTVFNLLEYGAAIIGQRSAYVWHGGYVRVADELSVVFVKLAREGIAYDHDDDNPNMSTYYTREEYNMALDELKKVNNGIYDEVLFSFRKEIEDMEATRLQWSLNAPSEMEAAAAEAEAELDEQFARRLDFINEANSLTEVLAESAEPAPVQQILGKLGFYWGYMSLVLCVFLGVIAYVVM